MRKGRGFSSLICIQISKPPTELKLEKIALFPIKCQDNVDMRTEFLPQDQRVTKE